MIVAIIIALLVIVICLQINIQMNQREIMKTFRDLLNILKYQSGEEP